jgi:hypothetical protein
MGHHPAGNFASVAMSQQRKTLFFFFAALVSSLFSSDSYYRSADKPRLRQPGEEISTDLKEATIQLVRHVKDTWFLPLSIR